MHYDTTTTCFRFCLVVIIIFFYLIFCSSAFCSTNIDVYLQDLITSITTTLKQKLHDIFYYTFFLWTICPTLPGVCVYVYNRRRVPRMMGLKQLIMFLVIFYLESCTLTTYVCVCMYCVMMIFSCFLLSSYPSNIRLASFFFSCILFHCTYIHTYILMHKRITTTTTKTGVGYTIYAT